MGAAWLIVREWSEQQLGVQFPSLHALACYLVLNLSVCSGSTAATLVTAFAENQLKGNEYEVVFLLLFDVSIFVVVVVDDQSSAAYGSSKHREMQLQLQKKLQQKSEVNRDHKRKIQVRYLNKTKFSNFFLMGIFVFIMANKQFFLQDIWNVVFVL